MIFEHCKGCIFYYSNYSLNELICLKKECHPVDVKDCDSKTVRETDNLMEFWGGKGR